MSAAGAAETYSGSPSQKEYDVAVLGLGAFGSAAAYHLASRGVGAANNTHCVKQAVVMYFHMPIQHRVCCFTSDQQTWLHQCSPARDGLT
jgi:hypothetical protein